MCCKIEAEVSWKAKNNSMVFWVVIWYRLVVCCRVYGSEGDEY